MIYRIGNLIEADELIIAHGCNAKGIMGSGVAKAIRSAYPKAYYAYVKAYKSKGLSLGEIIWSFSENKIIANCITQESFGVDGKRYVCYDAIAKSFDEIDQYMLMLKANNFVTKNEMMFAIPRIGAGLGGGDWEVISDIINETCQNSIPVVYDLEEIPGTGYTKKDNILERVEKFF